LRQRPVAVLPINYKDQKGKNKDLIRTQFWAFTEK
jgi:hypothetical protein